MAIGRYLKILVCVGFAFVGVVRAQEDFVAGPLYSDFKLTLSPGRRGEVVGPFFYSQQVETERQIGFPPLFSWTRDPDLNLTEVDLGYPLISFRRYGGEYRLQIYQLLSWAGGRSQKEDATHRFTLFPIYFQQRNAQDPSQDYTALVPFYGHLKKRLMRDDIRFVLFPFYSVTSKKDVVTHNYLFPFYHERYGNQLIGRQFWPFYGKESKGVTYRTNQLEKTEIIGGHERFFAGFPIYTHNKEGLGTDNPSETLGVIPFYVRQRSPKRDSTTYGWTMGYTVIDDAQQKYQERDLFWPLFVKAWGEGKTETRIFPFYNHARNESIESDWYLWPAYKVNYMHAPPLERKRTRILFLLYSDTVERNTNSLASKRRVEMWPLFSARRDMNGDRRLQVLSILEPLFPNNKSIPRDFAPVYSLWRWERNAKTGDSSQSFLWNFYRREQHKADPRSVGGHGAGGSGNRQTGGLPYKDPIKDPCEQLDDCKKISFLFGLIQYNSDFEGRWWRVCYFSIGRKCAGAAASTH